jgi:uncharacterized NTF2-like protein DUF6841
MTAWREWFDRYLDTFAACARGDRETAALLSFYGVPMVITSDEGVIALTTDEEVAAVMQGQLDGLRAAGYHHSEALHAEVAELNSTSALYRGTFSRRHRDGGEIACVTVTYVLTNAPAGRGISILAAHGGDAAP